MILWTRNWLKKALIPKILRSELRRKNLTDPKSGKGNTVWRLLKYRN